MGRAFIGWSVFSLEIDFRFVHKTKSIVSPKKTTKQSVRKKSFVFANAFGKLKLILWKWLNALLSTNQKFLKKKTYKKGTKAIAQNRTFFVKNTIKTKAYQRRCPPHIRINWLCHRSHFDMDQLDPCWAFVEAVVMGLPTYPYSTPMPSHFSIAFRSLLECKLTHSLGCYRRLNLTFHTLKPSTKLDNAKGVAKFTIYNRVFDLPISIVASLNRFRAIISVRTTANNFFSN